MSALTARTAEGGEREQDRDLDHRHEGLGVSGRVRAADVQPDEGQDDQQRQTGSGERNRQPQRRHGRGDVHPVQAEQLLEVGGEAQRVQRPRDHVGEPEHPPHEKGRRARQDLLDERVAAAALGHRAGQLRVGQCGECGDDPVEPNTRMAAGPAMLAASPVSTKIPAPIMAPTPIMTVSRSPRLRSGSWVSPPPLMPSQPPWEPLLSWARSGESQLSPADGLQPAHLVGSRAGRRRLQCPRTIHEGREDDFVRSWRDMAVTSGTFRRSLTSAFERIGIVIRCG